MALDSRTQRQLLAAALADPDAEAPRLVYADWLEEQGDPLAELVRVQVTLAREHGERPKGLAERERQLLAGLGFDRPARRANDRFGGPRPTFPDWTYQIDRGLVTLCVHQVQPPTPPPVWFERFGWHAIRLESPEGDDLPLGQRDLADLLASPLMDRCLGLDFSRARLKIKAIRLLAESQRVRSLLWLDLWYHLIGLPAAKALSASPHFGELVALDLMGRKLSDDAAVTLIDSGAFPSLRRLSAEGIGPPSILALANNTQLPHLEVLEFRGTRFDQQSAEALASSTRLPALTRLHVGTAKADLVAGALAACAGLPSLREVSFPSSPLTDKGAVPLIRSPHRASLRALDLDRVGSWGMKGIGAATIAALAQTDRFFRCGSLRLWACGLTDEAVRLLADSPHAEHLRELTIGFAHITDEGARALASSPHLKKLRRLDLYRNQIGGEGVAALTDPKAFPELVELRLGGNAIGDLGALSLARWAKAHGMSQLALEGAGLTGAGVAALVADEAVAGLDWLGLGGNPIGDEGIRAIAASPHLSALRRLAIYAVGMTDAGAIALARSKSLPEGLQLVAVDNTLSLAGKQALRERFGEQGAGVL